MENIWEDLWSVVLGCWTIVILVVFVIVGAAIVAFSRGQSGAAFIIGGVLGLILGVLVIFVLKKILEKIDAW